MTEAYPGEGGGLKHVWVRECVRALAQQAGPGSPLPSERALADEYAVARMTVRQAIDALVAEGLVTRIPGRGTFTATEEAVTRVLGLTEELSRMGRKVANRTVLARREQVGPGVGRSLEIPRGAPVVHWRRLRFSDGMRVCLEDVYLPARLVDGLTATLPASLYAWLEDHGLRPTRAEDHWSADRAGAAEAAQLEVTEGQPVLRKQRRALCRERPVEVSQSVFRGDRYTLRLNLASR